MGSAYGAATEAARNAAWDAARERGTVGSAAWDAAWKATFDAATEAQTAYIRSCYMPIRHPLPANWKAWGWNRDSEEFSPRRAIGRKRIGHARPRPFPDSRILRKPG